MNTVTVLFITVDALALHISQLVNMLDLIAVITQNTAPFYAMFVVTMGVAVMNVLIPQYMVRPTDFSNSHEDGVQVV